MKTHKPIKYILFLIGFFFSPILSYASTNIVCMGDSVTYGLNPNNSSQFSGNYPQQLEYLLKQNGLDVQVTNTGVCSASITPYLQNNNFAMQIASNQTSIKNADIITYLIGINDYNDLNKTTSSYNKFDAVKNLNTIRDILKSDLLYIKQLNPSAQIICILPLPSYIQDPIDGDTEIQGPQGFTLADLCNMELNVARDFNISTTSFPSLGMKIGRNEYADKQLHPCEDQYFRMAQLLAVYLAPTCNDHSVKPKSTIYTINHVI